MKKRLATNKMWIWLSLLLLLFLGSRYFLDLEKPIEYPAYASDSPSPSGVKALYTYLENHHTTVMRWHGSPDRLPRNTEGQLLMMIEPSFMPGSADLDAYTSFIEDGNTVILFSQNPKGLFGINTEFVETDLGVISNQEGLTFTANATTNVRLQTNEQDDILLSDDAGTFALKREIGNGKLIVSTNPNWLINRDITIDDHLELVLSFIDEADSNHFLFDEYIHDISGVATILKVYPKWFILLMAQASALTLLWLWYSGKRFGPILIPREETVRFSDEGIRALAAWYLRGRRYHDSLLIQADYVKTLLHERWRIPYHLEWSELVTQLERKLPQLPKDELASFLTGLTIVLKKEQISKQEFLLWSKKLEKIRTKVEDV